MLKRSGAIMLTLLYFITATGFALNLHYCGKLLTDVKIDAPAKGCIDPMVAKMKCCQDKQLIVKIKDAHQSQAGAVLGKLNGFAIARLPFAEISFYTQSNSTPTNFYRSPPDPPLSNTPVFIKNCAFRI